MDDVLVVGGGPVGLFLGLLLAAEGLRFRVLERRATPSAHSRAIGIHLPALQAFETVGLTAPLRRQAWASAGRWCWASVRWSWGNCP